MSRILISRTAFCYIAAKNDFYVLEIANQSAAMEAKLEDRVRNTTETCYFAHILELIEDFDIDEFTCFSALFPEMEGNAGFIEKYEQLYFKHMLQQRANYEDNL